MTNPILRFRPHMLTPVHAFVACLAIALCLIQAATARAADGPVWLINANGYTPTKQGQMAFSALHIGADGRIKGVFPQAPKKLPTNARIIDVGGRTVIPGLIDSHAHLLSEARLEREVDLVGAESLQEALARVALYLEDPEHRDGWVLGRGWNQVLWEGKAFPTSRDLDSVEAKRPVYLGRIDGHAAWANSRAMSIAGIDKDTPDPVGGKIVRDEQGEATGVLVDAAMRLVRQHIPPEASEPSENDIRATVARLNREGLTGVHQAGITIDWAKRLDKMYRDGGLPLRLYLMLSADQDLDEFGEPWLDRHDGRLTVRAVKLYSDGALGSHGAAMIDPYSDKPDTRGLLFQDDATLTAAVARVHKAGFQVGVHAIGDDANRQVLDAIEAAQRDGDASLRHRIEHTQILTLDDLPRLARLGVIASMQPVHATSDMNMAEDRIGKTRIQGAYAWRRLLDRGTIIAAGSDFPVELSNPFHGLYAAIARQDDKGMPEGGWYPDQAMTRPEALAAFTLSGAYAAHQEKDLGSLEVGKWADFLILDRDIMTIAARKIRDTRVLETWISGTRVHRAER